jgi:putative tricarboxylic transport membrane protein
MQDSFTEIAELAKALAHPARLRIMRLLLALPGTGGEIAALMAYDHAKRVTRNPKPPSARARSRGWWHPRPPTTPPSAGPSCR